MPWVKAKPTRPDRRHIVYAPFAPKYNIRSLGTSWEASPKYIVRRYDGASRHLDDVDAQQDVLYVVAHCEAGGRTLSDNAGEQIDAYRLARRLVNEGLDKKHRIIKLYACEGGRGLAPHLPSFHTQLFWELKRFGYWDVELFGYLTTVTSVLDDGHRYAMHLGQIIGRARQFRISSSDMNQGARRGLAPRR